MRIIWFAFNFFARTCYFWRNKRKQAFGIQMFFVQFCQYKWYTSGIYCQLGISPTTYFPGTRNSYWFWIFSSSFFLKQQNRPFGRFGFSLDRETPHAWQLERSGWGRLRWKAGEKVFKGWKVGGWNLQASFDFFHQKRHQKLWWLNPSILRDAIHRVILVTTQKMDSG